MWDQNRRWIFKFANELLPTWGENSWSTIRIGTIISRGYFAEPNLSTIRGKKIDGRSVGTTIVTRLINIFRYLVKPINKRKTGEFKQLMSGKLLPWTWPNTFIFLSISLRRSLEFLHPPFLRGGVKLLKTENGHIENL